MKKIKVFVAMSGGVDSSVSAALLKKKRYDVSGVFIRGYYPKEAPCTWREDRRDAMRVASILDIPFYTFDFSKEYKKRIIDYMIKEYKDGRTPNPDIMCNKYIKFDLFLKKAREMGADMIATGHYVKISNLKSQISNLLIAKDKNKDQSYFLWTLKQEQLKYCLFPLGNYLKENVRKMAKKFKLPVAEKKDSQGLCFVGEFKMEDFLKNYIKPKPGKILNEKGVCIGAHNGTQYYTIGQRHGIGAMGKEPYYVVEKNLEKNILIVASKKEEKKFYKKEIKVTDLNWLSGCSPDIKKSYYAKIRYRQPFQKCHLESCSSSEIKVVFDEPQRAVASGQSLVLYGAPRQACLPAGKAQGEKLLGGGIII